MHVLARRCCTPRVWWLLLRRVVYGCIAREQTFRPSCLSFMASCEAINSKSRIQIISDKMKRNKYRNM